MSTGTGWGGRRRSLVAAAVLLLALGTAVVGSRWSPDPGCPTGRSTDRPAPEPPPVDVFDNVDDNIALMVIEVMVDREDVARAAQAIGELPGVAWASLGGGSAPDRVLVASPGAGLPTVPVTLTATAPVIPGCAPDSGPG